MPVDRSLRERRRGGDVAHLLAQQIVGQLVIELFRYPGAMDGPARGGLAPWRLRIIDDRLAEQLTAPTLVELARLCRLLVRQLTRGFRASRGCSIGEYVARSQIDRATRMLDPSSTNGRIVAGMRPKPRWRASRPAPGGREARYGRRFFQSYLIDVHGDRGAYNGQLMTACDGSPGSLCDLKWNASADPRWSQDGKSVTFR